jgi:hypothetical protein
MKFHRHDDKLICLYWANVKRLPALVDEGGGIFRVASRSQEGLWHKVVITNDEGDCTCWANYNGKPCVHLARAAESIDHEREFQEQQIAKHNGIRARLPFEPKLLKQWRKVYAKDYPAGAVAPVVCVGVPF